MKINQSCLIASSKFDIIIVYNGKCLVAAVKKNGWNVMVWCSMNSNGTDGFHFMDGIMNPEDYT